MDQIAAKRPAATDKDRIAVATMPSRNESKPFVEGSIVRVHNNSPKTIRYYFTDGKMIEIAPGQAGDVPENMAEVFERESGGFVSRREGEAKATDLRSELSVEKARSASLEKQLLKMAEDLESLKKLAAAKSGT